MRYRWSFCSCFFSANADPCVRMLHWPRRDCKTLSSNSLCCGSIACISAEEIRKRVISNSSTSSSVCIMKVPPLLNVCIPLLVSIARRSGGRTRHPSRFEQRPSAKSADLQVNRDRESAVSRVSVLVTDTRLKICKPSADWELTPRLPINPATKARALKSCA